MEMADTTPGTGLHGRGHVSGLPQGGARAGVCLRPAAATARNATGFGGQCALWLLRLLARFWRQDAPVRTAVLQQAPSGPAGVPAGNPPESVSKVVLRQWARQRRAGLTDTDVRQASARVCARVLGLPEFRAARAVALFVPLPGEIDVNSLIKECQRQGKDRLFPRFAADTGGYRLVPVHDLEAETAPGRFGIREPLPQLAAASGAWLAQAGLLWIVPGLVFDPEGTRLGRGGGWYDRLLAQAPGLKVGVAFDWQLLPRVPRADRDVSMDIVVTETRVFRHLGSGPCAGPNG